MTREPLGWIGIVRLGLVQSALGSVVVLTTSAADEDILRSYQLHANAYVTKPVTVKALGAALSKLLDTGDEASDDEALDKVTLHHLLEHSYERVGD